MTHLQEHPHADLVSLQDLIAGLPNMLLPLDVALSTALLNRRRRKKDRKGMLRKRVLLLCFSHQKSGDASTHSFPINAEQAV